MNEDHEMKPGPVEQGLVIDGIYDVCSRRTHQQNNLYWGVLRQISPVGGSSAEWLHAFFKKRFLPTWGVDSTVYLTARGFALYIQKVAEFAESEWGVHLDLPAFDPDLENSRERVQEATGVAV